MSQPLLEAQPSQTMIVGSFGLYMAETPRDHEKAWRGGLAQAPSAAAGDVGPAKAGSRVRGTALHGIRSAPEPRETRDSRGPGAMKPGIHGVPPASGSRAAGQPGTPGQPGTWGSRAPRAPRHPGTRAPGHLDSWASRAYPA